MTHTLQLLTPSIPKAFSSNSKIMQVLCATVEDFSTDEQQAIFYFHHLDLSPGTIARTMQLTEQHVTSVLGLYAERLTCKLELFKQVLTHDKNETLQVRDILLPWSA